MANVFDLLTNSKIQFEVYSLDTDKGYAEKVKKVFKNIKVENNGTAMEIPFPKMSRTDLAVWEEYCPAKMKLKDADIALHQEALGVIERYADKFDSIEVWYESGDQVDPILVGKKYRDEEAKQKEYTWNMDSFLLCRWGEALKDFAEIKKEVFEAHIRREKVRLQKELNNLEFDAMEKFGV